MLAVQGAVGLRIRVYDRIMCFVNCHFAAHLEAVNRRNADFDHVYRTMTFGRPTNLFNAAAGTLPYLYCSLAFSMYLFWIVYRFGLPLVLSVAAGASSAAQMLRSTNVRDACSSELFFSGGNLLPFGLMIHYCFGRLGVPPLLKACLNYLRRTW